ncbi:unnamed protein product [Ostreobium quekettii]|uniref:EF-hand domain-containing protein n=1 Tax=Ostreobium quekettii TaxID=121088 RepID=A0A8S1J6D4_9CHLO|nr:unnamed protein product [Ostreobium quekettii]
MLATKTPRSSPLGAHRHQHFGPALPRRGPATRSRWPDGHRRPGRRFGCRAEKEEEKGNGEGQDGNGRNERSKAREEGARKYREQLAKQGVDKATANKMLEVWKKQGMENPDQLRRMFVKGTLRPLGGGAIQLLLDLGATVGAWYAVQFLRSLDPFPLQGVLEFLIVGGSAYYAVSVIFDLLTLASILIATVQFGANSEEFLEAVRELAGQEGGGGWVVGKAKTAVNTLKVVQALNELSASLKDKAAQRGDDMTTLENLSAYFILSKAEEQFDFKPEKYDLTEKEAYRLALTFSAADLNDDGVIERSELQKLVDTLGTDLSEDELAEAVRLLDTNQNNVIDFTEFVDFWQMKCKVPPAKAAS